MNPYREAAATEILEATTREGLLRLEVAPRHTLVRLGEHIRLSIADRFVTLTGQSRHNRKKKRSYDLASAGLQVARALPEQDLGIWYLPTPEMATRLLGCRPLDLLHSDGLDALRRLDQVAQRLSAALAPHASGAMKAVEIGHGADRVLIIDQGERLVFYVRPLFREMPRRALEVNADGKIRLINVSRLRKVGEREIQCTSRYGVTAIGDYVRFADPTGQDLGSVAIPWVTPEERREIVEIIGRRIDHQAAPRP